MYNLYRRVNGKITLMMTDTRKNIQKRLKVLKASSRKGKYTSKKIEYHIEEAKNEEKFYKEPHDRWRNYNKPGPKKIE